MRTIRPTVYALLAMACCAASAAQPSRVSLHIEARPMRLALKDLGEQTGLQIMFRAEDVAGDEMTAPPVTGELSPREALEKLLANSGLQFRFVNPNTVLVSSKESMADDGTASMAVATVRLAQADQDDVRPDTRDTDVVIEGKRRASTATKFELDVVDTPQSIKAITSDIIDLASIRQFQDLTKVDASTTTKGVDNGTQQLTFRGFDVDSSNGMLVDGIRTQTGFTLDLGPFERIEILKGPSSSLYGTNAVGGMINSITKQPSATPAVMASTRIGSFDLFHFEADSTGPVTQDGRLTYRLFGAYENGGDFVDYSHNEAKVAYGALRYELTEATTVDFNAHYQTRVFPANGGIAPFTVTPQTDRIRIPDVPASRLAGSRDTRRDGDFLSFRNGIKHVFPNAWQLQLVTQHSSSEVGGNSAVIYDFDGIPDNGDVDKIFLNYGSGTDEVWGADLSLLGDFEFLGRTHSLYISGDYRHTVSEGFQVFAGSALLPGMVFNLFDPDYAVFSRQETALDFSGPGFGGGVVYRTKLEILGGTMQLMLHPTERLTMLLSGRIDHQKQVDRFASGSPTEPVLVDGKVAIPLDGTPDVWKVTTVTPQVGATFALARDVNLYATYGESFIPQTGYTWDGRAWRPENGWQVEAGVKGGFWNNKVTLSLAAFHMVRGNILGADQNAPEGVFGTIEIGEHRSRGVEFEAFGTLRPGWTFIASASTLDVVFNKADNALDLGTRVTNVPKFAFSAFTSYEIQAGPLAGLGFSGGIANKSDRVWGQPSAIGRGPVDAGGYTTADLRSFYKTGNLLFDVRVNNVFDEKYYNTQDGSLRGRLFVGRPREVVAGITYKF